MPSNIKDLLTARSLAFWIIDDGGKRPSITILHTRSYRRSEVELLQEALIDNFNLKTKLYEKTPNQWVIIIIENQDIKLKNIVSDYIIPSIRYKI